MVSYWSLLVLPVFAATVCAAPVADPGLLGAAVGAVVNTASSAGNAVVNTASNAGNAVVETALGTVFNVTAPLEGVCTVNNTCSVNVNGSLTNLLVDGANYSGQLSISGWCNAGDCYGAIQSSVSTPAIIQIACNRNSVCNATISGAVNEVFSNGKQLSAWGWLTPSGYCLNGTCVASLNALGDPAY